MKILLPLLIIVMSVIYGLPHLIIVKKLGQSYDPLVISASSPVARDKTFAYAPFVKFILKGNIFLGESYTKEYSSYPTPFLGETFPSIIMAILSLATGSIDRAFLAADFIFPPIILVLIFLIAKIYIKSNYYALSVAFLTSVARDFISVIPAPKATYEYFAYLKDQNYHLFLSRNFHPQITFIFFLLAFIFLIKMISFPQRKLYLIFFSVSFSLLSYSYIFYWTYFLFFYCMVIFYFLIKKNMIVLKNLFIAGLFFLLMSAYYFINLYQFYNLPIASDFILKSSLKDHPFAWTVFRYFFLSLLFLYIFKDKGEKYFLFFLMIISAVLIAISSKVITGQDLETLHYLRRAAMQFATVGFFIIIYRFINSSKKTVRIVSSLLIIFSLIFAFRVQSISAAKVSQSHLRNTDQEVVLEWLNSNTPKDSVISSLNTDFNSILPIYTDNKIFFPPTDRTITPTEEGIKRFAILANLLGITENNQKLMLQDKNLVTYLFIYQAYIPGKGLSVNSPRNLLAQNELDRLSFFWEEELKNFQLDYLVITPKEIKYVQPNTRYLQVITSINEYIILKVHRI